MQIRTLLYMITHDTYSTQLFQLRFKVFPQLSGKVKTSARKAKKCGRPYPTSKVNIFSTLHPFQDCQSATSQARASAASWSVR